MIGTPLTRRLALPAVLFSGGVLLAGGALLAAEPPASTENPPEEATTDTEATTDEALLRSLLGEDDTQSPGGEMLPRDVEQATDPSPHDAPPATEPAIAVDPQAIARLLDRLRSAEEQLANGETGEPTRTAQSDIISELHKLIEDSQRQQSDSQSGQDASGSPRPQPSGMTSAQPMPADQTGESTPPGAAGVPSGPPKRNLEGKAEESSDRVREDDSPAATIHDFRSGLVRDVWGHLPERLRDQLLNAGPDRYLPEYDSLVRRYFESLARPQPSPAERRP